jgi:hypothetical protein
MRIHTTFTTYFYLTDTFIHPTMPRRLPMKSKVSKALFSTLILMALVVPTTIT